MATAAAHASDHVTIGDRTVSREDAPDALGERLGSLPQYVREARRFPVGIYRGLHFGVVLNPQFPPDVYLQGEMTRQSMLSREHQGPRAVLNAVERLANGYGSECVRVRQDLAIAESQLRDYQGRLDQPFANDAYLSELTALRDSLRASLSGGPAAIGSQLPSTSDLAGQIKALKAAHTVEAVPQRSRKSHRSAEEPVTARIRRRTEAVPDFKCSVNPEDTAFAATAPA
jgi:hypothetical protein